MNVDDPKLTAYALGDLEELDKPAIEQQLGEDLRARVQVDQLRAFGARLREELHAEPAPQLLECQRREVFEALSRVQAQRVVVPIEVVPLWRHGGVLSAMAACFVVGASISFLLLPAFKAQQDASRAAVAAASHGPAAKTDGAQILFVDRSTAAKDPEPRPESPKIGTASVAAPKWNESAALAAIQSQGGNSPAGVRLPLQSNVPRLAPLDIPAAPRAAAPVANWQMADSEVEGPVKKNAGAGRWIASRSSRGTGAEAGLIAAPLAAAPLKGESTWTEPAASRGQLASLSSGATVMGARTGRAAAGGSLQFLRTTDQPLSVLSVYSDSLAFPALRRGLSAGNAPDKVEARLGDWLNYFEVQPSPKTEGGDAAGPVSSSMEVGSCPWAPEHRLARVTVSAREAAASSWPAQNFVLLIEIGAAVDGNDYLALLQRAVLPWVDQIRERDQVSVAVYGAANGIVLEPTNNKKRIRTVIEQLKPAMGSTASIGLKGAFELAQKSMLRDGQNRVVLATAGHASLGTADPHALMLLAKDKAQRNISLTVIGMGFATNTDALLGKLTSYKGGNYVGFQTASEAKRAWAEATHAERDLVGAKLQVEFNPAQVASYRLLGNQGSSDGAANEPADSSAGQLKSGRSFTALYEIVPAPRAAVQNVAIAPLKYQGTAGAAARDNELLTLKVLFKAPNSDKQVLRESVLHDDGRDWSKCSTDFQWCAAVASFGLLYGDLPDRAGASWEATLQMAQGSRGADRDGARAEFVALIEKARTKGQ